MTRLVIWRHGRTGWNATHRIQGHRDVDLDATGRAQAAVAAERLAAQHPDVIVSSDLRRAADTAAALGAVTGLPVHTDARLRERYFGEWQGLTGDELAVAYPEQSARWYRGEAIEGCGVEDLDSLAKRVSAGVSDAIDRAGGGTVVVVTHGGSAKYVLSELLGWSREATGRVAGLANCHWTDLRLRPGRGWSLWAHNVGADVAGAVNTAAADATTVGAEVAGAEPAGPR